MNLQKKLANLLASTKRKRPYYCEVEYFENTKTSGARNWINTGIVPDNNTKWEVRLSFNDTTTGKLMGSGYTTLTRFNLGIESNKFRFAFNGWFDANSNITTPDTNAHTWIIDAPSKTFTIDAYSTTTTQTFGETTFPICLFGRCNSGNGSTETSNTLIGKIYYSKIWQNGVLVNDLIPVLDWDMTPCMYDRVTGELFYNMNSSGTGFTVGRQIHRVDYLESTESGKQWIDTGVNVNTSTDIIDFDFELVDTRVYKWFFGEYDENARIGLGSGDGENKRNYLYQQSATKVNDSEVYSTSHKFYTDQTGGYLNGTKIRSYVNFTSTSTIYLFNINISSESDYKCAAKVYRYKHYRNSALIRDFIPAIDENGVGFMFDKVTHNIFDNAGTDAFKYPAREVEYLESTDGHNYIDTGLNYFADYEIGIKLRNNVSNKALGNVGTNCMERISATAHNWRFTSGGSGYNSSIDILEYHVMKWKEDKIYADDVLLIEKVKNKGTTQMILFGADSYFPNMIYFCKLWNPDDGTLVRNFVPVYVNGKAGMYDKVNKEFYDNAGTGTFITGKIKESEYLE